MEGTAQTNTLKRKRKIYDVSKEYLYEEYIVKNLSAGDIAKVIGCDRKTIDNKLAKYGIVKTDEARKAGVRKKINELYGGATEAQRRFGSNSRTEAANKKRAATNIEKYGCENVFANEDIKALIRQSYHDNEHKKAAAALKRSEFYKAHNFSNNYSFYLSDSVLDHHSSSFENSVASFLDEIGISYEKNDRQILHGRELDFVVKDFNIAIECDGNFWHCTDCKSEAKYHQNKSFVCMNAGIRLVHIYEYEWDDDRTREIIKSLLKVAFGIYDRKIYARQCEVKVLANKDVTEFVNNNHIQKHRNAKFTYGLFFNGELVQMMSFSKNNKYQWEIIRSCSDLSTLVVGGSSKLFQHFINDHNPDTIFTYCDFNKFSGTSYEKLGMEYMGLTQPDMKWVMDGVVYNRTPNKNSYFKENADYQLFGSGSKKYLWKK